MGVYGIIFSMTDDKYVLPKLEEISDETSAQAVLQSWGFVDW